MSRHAAAVITVNNYNDKDLELCRQFIKGPKKIIYAICGKEICPTTKTPHLQIFARVKNAISINTWNKYFPRGHIIYNVKGEDYDQYIYCSKGTDIYERGTRPLITDKGQGTRNDIQKTRDMLEEGYNMRYILDHVNTSQAIRFAQNWLSYNEKKRNFKPMVFWISGETGTGKTKMAYDILKGQDIWESKASLKWWDGYDGHEAIIIDDFRPDHCSYETLLRICDRYPFSCEVKGGFRQLLAETIIITCNKSPEECYPFLGEKIDQLLRRIDLSSRLGEIDNGTEVEGNSRASTFKMTL